MRATCLAHLKLIDLNTLIIFGKKKSKSWYFLYGSWSSAYCEIDKKIIHMLGEGAAVLPIVCVCVS
jgi:hypothetical protein